ncbi:unnamed protein product [Camellia sinensis]
MIITLPIDGKNGIPNLNRAAGSKFDGNGTAYLIQANTQKRRKLEEDDNSSASEHVEAVADIGQKVVETTDPKPGVDVNRRRQGRGRGHAASGRGRGSRVNGQAKTQTSPPINSPSNGQLINSHHKSIGWQCLRLVKNTVVLPKAASYVKDDGWSKEQIGSDDRSSLEEEITSLRAKVAALEEDFKKSRQEAADYQQLCHQLEKELKDLKDYDQQMKPKRMKIISDLLISVSKAERQEARLKVRQDSLRLGSVGVIRAGTIISETWEDGQALKDLNAHLKHLLEIKEAVERQRKSLKKRPTDKGDVIDAETGSQEDDILMQDEIYKSRLASIKREEETVMRERDRYELEKGRLIREMKLSAYDLVEHRYVACKLHGLNAQWSEEKKQSYIRHAIREYNIHKTLIHHHIVRLWDIFEIDQNTFCTILEYCSGKDLDAVLKGTPILPEREARIIIVQIFQGLVYLNKKTQKIIHYDLKPGNVLFDEFGVAKVTDFGLSKIVEDDVGSQGMELTSQGAGTYCMIRI